MGLTVAVLSGFMLAALAPVLERLVRRYTGWLLALLPTGLVIYFSSHAEAIAAGENVRVHFTWVPALGCDLSFHLDGLGLLFAFLVTGMGTLVLVYAGGYLEGHAQLGRLYAALLVFMASMLGLVLADNLLALFVFWELTSLSSYLLIGFDHERPSARAAALQALLVTGGGGLALLAGLVLLGQAAESMELSILASRAGDFQSHALYVPATLLILLGAFTKSAQFPFHFWLPSAMEAPTPVSAYLHSATMVKAGVYLLARLSPVLGGTELWVAIVSAVGATTMLVGAAMALPQSDLKRLLAYSTVSALGTLTLLLGLGGEPAIHAAMAFLLGHALYKGALFLVAGAIDHETGTRDVDVLGGLGREMPVTALAAGVAALSMAGLPPLMGFVAKELFYEATLHAPSAGVLSALAVLANGLIVAVALVVGIRPFLGELLPTPRKAHEAPASLWLGPIVLAGLSMICGLWSGLGAESLLSAASASTGQSAPMHLKLWHGLTPALGLSVVTLAGGLAIYALRGLARRTVSPWERASAWGPTGAYDLALAGLNALAKGQTRLLQSGYLRSYLLIILATTVALVGVALARNGRIVGLNDFSDVRFYEAGLGLLILLATVMAVVAKTRLAAIAALGVVGYGVALIFVLFGAPDVAMTQFLVETLTVILFVLVFYHLPESRGESHALGRTRDALMAAAVGITVTTLVLIANDVSFHPTISGYYFDHSFAEAHGRNVVNVILVDFRGLDTLGEITVLAVAGIGVYALLRLRLAPAVVPAAAADADGSPNLPARDGDAGKSDEAGSDANGKEDGR